MTEERRELFLKIMWDYTYTPEDILLAGTYYSADKIDFISPNDQ